VAAAAVALVALRERFASNRERKIKRVEVEV
jgi:hypothetical protein